MMFHVKQYIVFAKNVSRETNTKSSGFSIATTISPTAHLSISNE